MTNTNDSGEGSLRHAIYESNASPGSNTISFDIPGTGLQVIKPSSSLPSATVPVVIDGYTQPGSSPNTAAQGDNATPMIVLDGSGLPDPTHSLGLEIKADNSTVRGLDVTNFAGVGVLFIGSNDHLEGSFVGVDPTGKVAAPNGLGVGVFGGSDVIGGTAPAARNLISGNSAGVGLASLELGTTTLIVPAAGGVIQDNLIGTDASGTGNLGNGIVGVAVIGSGNVVGGTDPGEANTIAFNGTAGTAGNPGTGVVVASLQQSADLPITLVSTGDLISGNSIYSNGTLGVGLLSVSATEILPLLNMSSADLPSVISGLVSNLKLGVAPNVHLRPAGGPNNFLNYPNLTSAVTVNGGTTVRGTLDGSPHTSYTIQFFSNPAADPSGHGQGQVFLGETTVSTGGDGLAAVVYSPPSAVPPGQVIAATAIDPGNDTSEFSNDVTVSPTAAASAPTKPVAATPSPTTTTPAAASTAPATSSPAPAVSAPAPATTAPTAAASTPAATTTAPTTATPAAHRVHKHAVILLGMTRNVVTADKQSVVHITGNGHLSKLGPITLSSAISSQSEKPLLSTPWLLHADLAVTTPKGQINVRISPGTIGLNPFAQPVHLQYSILGGTGSYQNAGGTGLVDLRLYQSIPTSASQLKAMGTELKTTGVPFSLTFHPGHLNKFGDFSGFWYKVIQTVVKTHGTSLKHLPARKKASK